MNGAFDSMNTWLSGIFRGAFAGLIWLGCAALGGTFVLGCGGGLTGSGAPGGDQMLAIATAGQIKIYTGIAQLAATGPAAAPAQTLSVANVLSVAFDFNRNLYYLVNSGTPGSDAMFFACAAALFGPPFPSCSARGGPIAGGQWLAIDRSGMVFVTSLTPVSGTLVSFPAASGPPATPAVVYTSTVKPFAYGGIAVDGSDTIYVTEQGSAASLANQLFGCTASCQSTTGSQADLTASITGSNPASVPGGPLATGHDGTSVFVGAANTTNHSSPLTRPVAFACSPGIGGLACQPVNATFPPLFGVDNPFVNTVGIAANASDDVYDAVLLDDGGDTAINLGPSFFGFTSAGTQFACSGAPSTCPVNQLPSVPIDSSPGSVPYGLAISPSP